MSAGSIAKISGSAQGIPGLTAAVLDVGTIDTDPDNVLTEVSAGRYRPDSEGYYLIVASGRFQATHNNRLNIKWEIERNSSAIAGTGGSGYSRNNGNPYSYPKAGAILHFNGTSDYFEVFHNRDVGAGAPAGSYNWTRCKVVQLSAGGTTSLPYGRYGTPTSGAYSGVTPNVISGWDVISETDSATVELQAGGTAIRLKEANRPYLIVYGLENSDAGTSRTTRVSDVTLAGTRIPHSCGYTYQRDSANQQAVPFGMALVRPNTANQDLNIRCWGYDDTLATLWGTFDSGSWTLSSAAGDAGVMVIALPVTTNIAIFEDNTANQTVSGATDVTINAMRTTVGTADSPFTRDDNTAVTVTSATEVLAYSGFMVERTASSGTRNTSATRWVVEGVELTSDTEYGNYLRGEQNSDDTKNMAFGSLFVNTVSINDTFVLEKFDPGTDDGANDATSWGGAFFIDLSSLGSAPTVPTITDVETDEDFRDGDTALTITGAVFEATQGTGKVEISDNATYATGTKIAQTITSWGDTSIDFTAVLSTLAPGPLWLWVTNNTGDRNTTGFSVNVHRKVAITLSASANVPAGGEATTALLTPPSGKTTGDFSTGRRWDDENGIDTLDHTADTYTEYEWWIEATNNASGQYEFRVLIEDTVLDTYTITPKWTIGAGSPPLYGYAGTLSVAGGGTLSVMTSSGAVLIT